MKYELHILDLKSTLNNVILSLYKQTLSYFFASSEEGLRFPPTAAAAEPFGPLSQSVAMS